MITSLTVRGVTEPKSRKLRVNGVSDSCEDHLERIHELIKEKGYARVSDIAERLGAARPSVTNMVQRLAERGLVNYQRYRGFTLTEQGRAVAESIEARHETLTAFFGLLGLAPETVVEEVEDIEHHLRPQTLEMLEKLVEYWRSHPQQLRAFLRAARKSKP